MTVKPCALGKAEHLAGPMDCRSMRNSPSLPTRAGQVAHQAHNGYWNPLALHIATQTQTCTLTNYWVAALHRHIPGGLLAYTIKHACTRMRAPVQNVCQPHDSSTGRGSGGRQPTNHQNKHRHGLTLATYRWVLIMRPTPMHISSTPRTASQKHLVPHASLHAQGPMASSLCLV